MLGRENAVKVYRTSAVEYLFGQVNEAGLDARQGLMARIYVETTVPSFYHEVRSEPEMIARRNWTREWWSLSVGRDELVTGPPVIAELERGTFPAKSDALKLIDRLPVLAITEPILEIVDAYISHKVMRPIPPAMPSIWPWHRFTLATSW